MTAPDELIVKLLIVLCLLVAWLLFVTIRQRRWLYSWMHQVIATGIHYLERDPAPPSSDIPQVGDWWLRLDDLYAVEVLDFSPKGDQVSHSVPGRPTTGRGRGTTACSVDDFRRKFRLVGRDVPMPPSAANWDGDPDNMELAFRPNGRPIYRTRARAEAKWGPWYGVDFSEAARTSRRSPRLARSPNRG